MKKQNCFAYENAGKLKKYIEDNDLSASNIARRTGYSPSMICALLTGKSNGSMDTWMSISRVTGLEFDFCVDETMDTKGDGKEPKNIDGIPYYVFKMLDYHKNTVIGYKVAKRIGIGKIIEILKNHGYYVFAEKDICGGFILRIK